MPPEYSCPTSRPWWTGPRVGQQGLRLAALSLTGHPDPARFAEQFSGTERTVAEYLLAEVLGRQSEPVRTLLLRTSILDSVNGGLADLLTGAGGGERMLQDLEQANALRGRRRAGGPGNPGGHSQPAGSDAGSSAVGSVSGEPVRRLVPRAGPALLPASRPRRVGRQPSPGDAAGGIHTAARYVFTHLCKTLDGRQDERGRPDLNDDENGRHS